MAPKSHFLQPPVIVDEEVFLLKYRSNPAQANQLKSDLFLKGADGRDS